MVGIPSLKLTAKAPKNGWLEYDRFLFGGPVFQGRTVSFKEGMIHFLFGSNTAAHFQAGKKLLLSLRLLFFMVITDNPMTLKSNTHHIIPGSCGKNPGSSKQPSLNSKRP